MVSHSNGSSAVAADPVAPAARDASSSRVVLVSAGAAVYGIPLPHCREIVEARVYTPLPGCGAAVCGLINLRGRLVTVLDLSAWLRHPPAASLPGHSVVVLEHGGKQVGLAVEAVLRILPVTVVPGEALRPLPLPPDEPGTERALAARVFAMLDPDAVFRSVLA